MTFSLRKRNQDPQPDDAVEETLTDDTTTDDDAQRQEPEGTSLGLLPALYQGVLGWCTWCSGLIGVGPTYALHGVSLWAAGYYDGWAALGVASGFLLAAAVFAPSDPIDRLAGRLEVLIGRRADQPDEEGEQKALEDTPEEAPEDGLADPLVTVMWRLIGGARGVHLKTLTEVLAKTAAARGERAPSKVEVEAALQAREIPLRDSVRDTRQKVNRGVHRDDLAAWEATHSPAEGAAPPTGP